MVISSSFFGLDISIRYICFLVREYTLNGNFYIARSSIWSDSEYYVYEEPLVKVRELAAKGSPSLPPWLKIHTGMFMAYFAKGRISKVHYWGLGVVS